MINLIDKNDEQYFRLQCLRKIFLEDAGLAGKSLESLLKQRYGEDVEMPTINPHDCKWFTENPKLGKKVEDEYRSKFIG